MLFYLLSILFAFSNANKINIDENGYLVFCPCMGRFGNQVDQMIGSFNFGKALNRTIVVPPFIEYHKGEVNFVPFEVIFQINKLAKFHRIIAMDKFMSTIAEKVWPISKRTVYCYHKRPVVFESSNDGGCNAKDGNPFKNFWDHFGIDFVDSNFYSPLHHSVDNVLHIQQWKDLYPASTHPVIAFVGAPTVFPISRKERSLQEYFEWSKNMTTQASDFLEKVKNPILGIHLRQQSDWDRVCNTLVSTTKKHIFTSSQCLGDNFEFGSHITEIMCLPDWDEITTRIRRYIDKENIRTIFLSTDKEDLLPVLKQRLNESVNIIKYSPSNLYLDLCILSKTDFFIGNCVSTYSAVATYSRLINKLPVDFWGFYDSSPKEDL